MMAPRAAQQRQPARDTSAEDESLLVAAMTNTESEIFTEAMGDDELELDGDTSLEEMDDPAGEETDDDEGVGDEDSEEIQARDDGDEPGDGDDDDQLGDDRRDQAEDRGRGGQERQERRFTLPPVDPSAARIAALEARLAQVETPRAEQRQTQQVPAELPDPVLDPAGFREGIASQIRAENQAATRTAILESNFRATEAAYDREDRREEFQLAASQLNKLSQRARTDPQAAAAVRSIVNAPDPGHALMQWAEDNLDLENFRQEQADRNREQAARLLGVDPADLEGIAPSRQAERPRQREARQERPRGEQRQQQPQRGGRRLPSLNSASGVGREGGNSRNLDPNGFDGSEDAIFTFATH